MIYPFLLIFFIYQENQKFRELYALFDPIKNEDANAAFLKSLNLVLAEARQLSKCARFVLDGPKENSAKILESIFDGYCMDMIVSLECSQQTLLKRMGLRGRDDEDEREIAHRLEKFLKNSQAQSKRLKSLISSGRNIKVMKIDAEPPVKEYYASSGLRDAIAGLVARKLGTRSATDDCHRTRPVAEGIEGDGDLRHAYPLSTETARAEVSLEGERQPPEQAHMHAPHGDDLKKLLVQAIENVMETPQFVKLVADATRLLAQREKSTAPPKRLERRRGR